MDASDREPDYRFTLANERTFLAWIRTALALIAGGVAVVQLAPLLAIPGVRHGLGTVLVAAGGLLAALAVRRWRRVQDAMRAGADMPRSLMPVLLAAMVVVITIAVIALIFIQR
jgi:putative membrane protein